MSTIAQWEFAWPWMAVAVFLPLLVRWLLRPVSAATQALKVPDESYFPGRDGAPSKAGRSRWHGLLPASVWLLLIVAACRPQIAGEELPRPVSGRNLVLAVDLSGSMEVNDFQLGGQRVDRLSATKAVAAEFIERRTGDRVGLILFGQQAYLHAPLTFDLQTVKTLLLESSIGLAGEKTAIGDAIGLAVKRLREAESDANEQVLILLTDGANTAGRIAPLQAAELAAAAGLKIYTIGIGAESMEIESVFGGRTQQVNPSTDLDEKTLRAIANDTGGQYFRATDTGRLADIYAALDELEPVPEERLDARPMIDVFYQPLLAALAVAILFLALAVVLRVFGRTPVDARGMARA